MNPRYRQASYLRSVHTLNQLPEDRGVEVAFAGRSNAGKSSVINRITDQKSLARVSRSPGRTRAINFFTLDEARFLVDLPGYGYAKVSAAMRRHWDIMLERYLRSRRSLRGLFLIMDVRHPLQSPDWQMIGWTHAAGLDLHVVLTKADKLSRGAATRQLHTARQALEREGVHATLQLFSSLTGSGIDDAHSVLDEWFALGAQPPAVDENNGS